MFIILQIISGKFYKTNNCHVTPKTYEFYSNLYIMEGLTTTIFTINYIETIEGISKYELKYDNKMEKVSMLVAVGDNEIVKQALSLISFYFQAYASISYESVSKIINVDERDNNLGISYRVAYTPSKENLESFKAFFERLIGARRLEYSSIIQCCNTYTYSIEIVNRNIDLAYSLLIYMLESLTQMSDAYLPIWSDYNKDQKDALDEVFRQLPGDAVETVKSILLRDSHLKLQSRFINFISNNISEEYFTIDAKNLHSPLRKSNLNQVLRNAYNIRSKYTHLLVEMDKEIKLAAIANGDTIIRNNDVYLTYNGLLRLSHQVILNYILKVEQVETEIYDWYNNLPNMISFPLANKYWLGKTENFNFKEVNIRFNGILKEIQTGIITNNMETNLLSLMQLYATKIPQAPAKEKITMLSSIILYNAIFEEESVLEVFPNYRKIIEKNRSLLNEKTPATLLVRFFTDEIEDKWTLTQYLEVYEKYEKNKYKPNSISYPRYFELITCLVIANEYLSVDVEKYQYWVNKAILDISGNYRLQIYLKQRCETNEPIDLQVLYQNKFML